MNRAPAGTSARTTVRGLGLAATVSHDVAEASARLAQAGGYHSFWLNNPPGANALHALASVASVQAGLWLGVGVIPLSHEPPEEIIRKLTEEKIPLNRFYLGLGSGGPVGGVERVRSAIGAIRRQFDAFIVVAALGPRMCRLAGAQADGVLLNWLTTDMAQKSMEWIREGAEKSERPVPRVMAYLRASLGPEAAARLEQEANRYGSYPTYAPHFKRFGVDARQTAIAAQSSQDLQRHLRAWNGVVDEIVIRPITAQDTIQDLEPFIQAAAPLKPARQGERPWPELD
ncbi:MAG: LLM class flavin-dependent oxidoreductase [Chloroflexota bacterium]